MRDTLIRFVHVHRTRVQFREQGNTSFDWGTATICFAGKWTWWWLTTTIQTKTVELTDRRKAWRQADTLPNTLRQRVHWTGSQVFHPSELAAMLRLNVNFCTRRGAQVGSLMPCSAAAMPASPNA